MGNKTINVQIANCWADVTLRQYDELKAIADNNMSNEDWVIEALVILSNLKREDIMALPYPEFVKLSQRLEFLNKEPETQVPDTCITIAGKKFDVTTAISNIVAGQFMDYKSIVQTKDAPMQLARICSCFIIPSGCKYGTDYDTEKHVAFLYDNLGVVEALSLSNFFMIQSNAYMQISLRSLRRMLKKTKKKTPEQAELIKQTIDLLQEAEKTLSALNGGSASCSKK